METPPDDRCPAQSSLTSVPVRCSGYLAWPGRMKAPSAQRQTYRHSQRRHGDSGRNGQTMIGRHWRARCARSSVRNRSRPTIARSTLPRNTLATVQNVIAAVQEAKTPFLRPFTRLLRGEQTGQLIGVRSLSGGAGRGHSMPSIALKRASGLRPANTRYPIQARTHAKLGHPVIGQERER